MKRTRLAFGLIIGMMLVGSFIHLGSLRGMSMDTPLIELKNERVIVSVGGEPIEEATITINRAFGPARVHLHAGINYVELQQVRAEDGRFLAAHEVSEIRLVGLQGRRWLDTTAEFSHDERSIRVQRINWGEVKPE